MNELLAVLSRPLLCRRAERCACVALVVVLFATTIFSSNALAAPPWQDVPTDVDAALTNAFTYQGRLDVGGAPITATCAMQFDLWSAATGGTQIGASQDFAAVNIAAGLFNVTLNQTNQFGATPFNGEARFLEMAVKCSSDAAFVTLPRQQLTATPYALTSVSTRSLQGRPVSNAAPAAGNVLTWNGSQWQGAALPAQIPTDWSAITSMPAAFADGVDNEGWALTGNPDASATSFLGTTAPLTMTIAISNTPALRIAPALNGTMLLPNLVFGGATNVVAPGVFGATISGGGGSGSAVNRVFDSFGVVSGGSQNRAGSDNGNPGDATGATIGGGVGNSVTGSMSTVAGGRANEVFAEFAAIGGGRINQAFANYSTIAGGEGAVARLRAQFAYAGGGFEEESGIQNVGSAQYSMYLLRRETANNVADQPLFLDGNNDLLTIPLDTAMAFEIFVAAQTDDGESGAWVIRGGIENEGGTLALLGAAGTTSLGVQAPLLASSVQVSVNNVNDSLDIIVDGIAGKSIRWVAVVHATEASWE